MHLSFQINESVIIPYILLNIISFLHLVSLIEKLIILKFIDNISELCPLNV